VDPLGVCGSMAWIGLSRTYGKDGALDDAIEADLEDNIHDASYCPPPAILKELCKNKESKDCPRHCL
jgi:hypothetical protein